MAREIKRKGIATFLKSHDCPLILEKYCCSLFIENKFIKNVQCIVFFVQITLFDFSNYFATNTFRIRVLYMLMMIS